MRSIVAMLSFLLLTTCGFAPALAGPVPQNCLANEIVAAKQLLETHGEVLAHVAIASISGHYTGGQHTGDHVMQIYVNPETRTWTGVVVHPASEGGVACQAGSGQAWLDITTITIPGDDA